MKALVVGGGIAGISAAIALRGGGVEVELIDKDPDWKVSGAGITITGPTLRAFKQLGVYDQIAERGYVGDGIRVCNVAGEFVKDLATPMPAEAGVPGSGGIMRPVLRDILSRRALDAGTQVRLGIYAEALVQDDRGVDVAFSDGTRGRYDLVVGADGIYSRTREQLFPDAPRPEYKGQYVWRIMTERPAAVDRRHYFLGGPNKVGFTPISDESMYLFVNERSEPKFLDPAQLPAEMIRLLEPYGGYVAEIRDQITEQTEVVLRPLESFVLPTPWHLHRVLLIGDAVHPTTPQLSSGAGMAVEDAIVLADELSSAPDVPKALEAVTARREERCRLVVDSSVAISRLEQEHAPPERSTAIVEAALLKLTEPI